MYFHYPKPGPGEPQLLNIPHLWAALISGQPTEVPGFLGVINLNFSTIQEITYDYWWEWDVQDGQKLLDQDQDQDRAILGRKVE